MDGMSAAATATTKVAPAAAPQPAPRPGVPRHVGIIMDGNGRWATARGLPRALGHKAGAEAARRVVEAAGDAGIGWLTLFAFSSENWQRPAEEVRDLTALMRHYLATEVARLVKEGVRLRIIGDRDRFGPETVRAIARAEQATAGGTRLNLTVALSYGGRAEIAAAAREIARRAAAGTLDPESVDEHCFSGFLGTAGMPDPDLIIRTSGEKRISNFLLWQAAYAEFVFQDVLWPDYGAPHLQSAIADFAGRERRYGARAA
nr:polyprenyl diphosphate synthase [Roseomonas sp. AR75]